MPSTRPKTRAACGTQKGGRETSHKAEPFFETMKDTRSHAAQGMRTNEDSAMVELGPGPPLMQPPDILSTSLAHPLPLTNCKPPMYVTTSPPVSAPPYSVLAQLSAFTLTAGLPFSYIHSCSVKIRSRGQKGRRVDGGVDGYRVGLTFPSFALDPGI